PREAIGRFDPDVVLAGEEGGRDQRRDAEVGVVDRHAGARRFGRDLDLSGLDVGTEQLAGRLLHSGDQVVDAALDQAEDAAFDPTIVDVVEVEAEQHLRAARPDAAGDDAADAQRHARPAEARDVIQAGLRALLALDADARAELLLAGDLEAAVPGGV